MLRRVIGISLCLILFAGLAVGYWPSGPGVIPAQPCAAVPVEVAAATVDEHDLACAAAVEALERFADCGIYLQRPLRIRVGPQTPRTPGRDVLGYFDAADGGLYVREIDSIPALTEGTPFNQIAHRDFFKSMVVHELVHAVLHQNAGRRTISRAGHEYLAYAFQIDSLGSGARERFLATVGKRTSTDGFTFSDVLLDTNPFLFAAHAFEHLAAAQDRCANLAGVLEGEPDVVSTSVLF
jgi:hypothetical protein